LFHFFSDASAQWPANWVCDIKNLIWVPYSPICTSLLKMDQGSMNLYRSFILTNEGEEGSHHSSSPAMTLEFNKLENN
jgi:hypothetical protein